MSHLTLPSNRLYLRCKQNFTFLCFVFFVCLLPLESWAQSFSNSGSFSFTGTHNPLRRPIFREFLPGEGLKVGPVQIHPFLGLAEVFTDNVFRTKTNRKSDFLTTIAPGIQAYMPFGGRHSFLLDYRAAQFLYNKFTENNVLTQHGVGHLEFDFPGGLKVNIQGGHVEGFDRRGSALDIQDRDITKWRTSSFLGQTRWYGPRGSIRLRSRYTRWHYKNNGQDSIRDRKNTRADITGFINATSSISGLLGASISNNTFDENIQLDSFTYGVFTGFEIEPTKKLSGEVRVGYSILNFDRAPISSDQQPPGSVLSQGGDAREALTVRGILIWRPTSRQYFNLQPFRLIRQSAVFNSSTFIQTGFSLLGTHKILDRLSLRGRIYYSNDKFEEDRRDNRFQWQVGLDYRTIKWLGFRLNYIFDRRSSNQNRFDYYSNTIMLSVQALL